MRLFSVQAQLTTVLFVALATIAQEHPTTPDLTPLIEAHNRVRAEAKLPALKANPQLTEAARAHALDMAEHQELSHEGSDGSTVSKRVKQRGYRYQDVGENIATGETTEQVMRMWMDSPPHRKNILFNFSEIGVAMAPDSEGSKYWCVVFGRPWPKVDTAKGPSAIIAALKRARSDAKRSVVKEDPNLTRVANYFARDLAARKVLEGQDRNHQTPFDILKRQDYEARQFGMSLASGQSDPAQVVKSWLERREDRDSLLANYNRIGVAVAVDHDGVPYWVVILAQTMR